MPIKLVPFFKELNVSCESDNLKEMHSIFDYKNALQKFYNTFIKFNPGVLAEFEIATDLTTQLSFPNIFRSNLSNLNLMESLTKSNTDYVTNHTGKMILCGADHLICNNVRNFFLGEYFDIGVWMNGDHINNTVVLVNKNEYNRHKVNKFFVQRYDIFCGLDDKTKSWYGDQNSLTILLDRYRVINRYMKHKEKNVYKSEDGLIFKFFTYGNLVKGIRKGGLLKDNPTNILIDFKGPQRKLAFENIYEEVMAREIND